MKKLFWILVLMNVMVLAYFKHDALSPAVSSLKPEIQPQQINILTEQSLLSYPERHAEAVANEPDYAGEALEHSNTSNSLGSHNATKPDFKPPESHPVELKTPEPQPVSHMVEPKPIEAKQADKAASAKPTDQQATTAGACYEWSSFNTARLNEALSLAQQLNIKAHTNLIGSPPDNVRYWIYKPPLATAEAAQIKADELRKLGVEDFFIVQDDPKWRNAISFGVFRDEKLADKLMQDLKNKGVKLLIKATRLGGQAVIKLEQVSTQQLPSLQKARSQFPDTVLKEMPCQ